MGNPFTDMIKKRFISKVEDTYVEGFRVQEVALAFNPRNKKRFYAKFENEIGGVEDMSKDKIEEKPFEGEEKFLAHLAENPQMSEETISGLTTALRALNNSGATTLCRFIIDSFDEKPWEKKEKDPEKKLDDIQNVIVKTDPEAAKTIAEMRTQFDAEKARNKTLDERIQKMEMDNRLKRISETVASFKTGFDAEKLFVAVEATMDTPAWGVVEELLKYTQEIAGKLTIEQGKDLKEDTVSKSEQEVAMDELTKFAEEKKISLAQAVLINKPLAIKAGFGVRAPKEGK
jgi:hypothetical protein